MPLQMDPEVRAGMTAFYARVPSKSKPAINDVESRRKSTLYKELLARMPTRGDVVIQDFYTDTLDGYRIMMRWYKKQKSSPGSAILYLHGGNFILGCVSWHDKVVENYVSLSGVPFLSVEYRLAPENKYPIPVTDAYVGLSWLHENAAALHIDVNRIGLMGDSAGAGLASAVTLLARQKNGPSIAKQILVYPVLDDRSVEYDPQLEGLLTYTHEDSITGWTAYLGDMRATPDVPETAAAARMAVAKGLPPTYIEVGELDIVRNACVEFAQKTANAGISVELHVRPGLPHCFEYFAPSGYHTVRAIEDRIRAILNISSMGS